jgi:hypothetical protein
MRTILKFDVGADGFLKMIGVLAVFAVVLLVVGFFFLSSVTHDLGQMR